MGYLFRYSYGWNVFVYWKILKQWLILIAFPKSPLYCLQLGLRQNCPEPNTIPFEPVFGVASYHNHLSVSMEWLLWIEQELGHPLQHPCQVGGEY